MVLLHRELQQSDTDNNDNDSNRMLSDKKKRSPDRNLKAFLQ